MVIVEGLSMADRRSGGCRGRRGAGCGRGCRWRVGGHAAADQVGDLQHGEDGLGALREADLRARDRSGRGGGARSARRRRRSGRCGGGGGGRLRGKGPRPGAWRLPVQRWRRVATPAGDEAGALDVGAEAQPTDGRVLGVP